MFRSRLLATFSCALLMVTTALFAESIVTDRPDFTESTDTIPTHYRVQIEGGYTYSSEDTAKTHTIGEILCRVPLNASIELRIGFPSFITQEGTSGLSDANLGAKFHLADAKGWIPNLAVIAMTSIPLNDPNFGDHDLQPLAKLCFGWDLNDTTSLSGNLNVGQTAFSLSLGQSWTNQTQTFMETYVLAPSSKNGPSAWVFNGGVTYLFTPDFQGDIRIGKDIQSPTGDYFVGIGSAVRI